MIQGPPGTGKTHTISEIIRNLKFQLYPHMISTRDVDDYRIYVDSQDGISGTLRSSYCPCLDRVLSKTVCIKSDAEGVKIDDQHWSISAKKKSGKVLICAPSNCAVDELMQRVMETKSFPEEALIRYGTLSENTPKCVTVRHCEQLMQDFKKQVAANQRPDISIIRDDLRAILGLDESQDDIYQNSGFGPNTGIQEIEEKAKRILDGSSRTLIEFLKKHLNRVIWKLGIAAISKAKIVFTTLNSSGSSKIKEVLDSPEVLIVDEACQSSEVQTLVALSLNPKRVFLVGDHKQLPATTFLFNSKKLRYEVSMFERLVQMGHYVHMLATQYRMVPELSFFISFRFYSDQLRNGANVEDLARYLTAPYKTASKRFFFGKSFEARDFSKEQICRLHSFYSSSNRVILGKPDMARKTFFRNFRLFLKNMNTGSSKESPFHQKLQQKLVQRCTGFFFFDIEGVTSRVKKSFRNTLEGLAVKQIVSFFFNFGVHNIGVISPYKAQTKKIRQQLADYNGKRGEKGLEINTIDGFQGKQKEIIVISCVKSIDDRSRHNQQSLCSVGFLDDPRRGNVALSRAKFAVFIVGNRKVLEGSASFWKDLLGMLDSHGRSFLPKECRGLVEAEAESTRKYIHYKMLMELFLDVCKDFEERNDEGQSEEDWEQPRDGSDDEWDKGRKPRWGSPSGRSNDTILQQKRRNQRNDYKASILKKRRHFEYKLEQEHTSLIEQNEEQKVSKMNRFLMQLKEYNSEIQKALNYTRCFNKMQTIFKNSNSKNEIRNFSRSKIKVRKSKRNHKIGKNKI